MQAWSSSLIGMFRGRTWGRNCTYLDVGFIWSGTCQRWHVSKARARRNGSSQLSNIHGYLVRTLCPYPSKKIMEALARLESKLRSGHLQRSCRTCTLNHLHRLRDGFYPPTGRQADLWAHGFQPTHTAPFRIRLAGWRLSTKRLQSHHFDVFLTKSNLDEYM